MSASALFRFKSITGENGVFVAMKHNKRELQAERGSGANIDATRTHLNYSLLDPKTPKEIALHVKVRMLNAGIERTRSNAVRAIEFIFSLPISWHCKDTSQYFKDCFEWLARTFGLEIFAYDVHLDESAPHAHALVLPIMDGRLQGSVVMGNRSNVKLLQNDFHAQVASKYGLIKSFPKKLSLTDKKLLERQVLVSLKTDPVMQSVIWPVIRDSIAQSPIGYAEMLDIKTPMPRGNGRSFVDIMVSKGRGKP